MHKGDLSILIPDGESHLSLSVARCLTHVPGVKVHVLSHDAWPHVRFSRHRASFTCRDRASGNDPYLEEIARTAKRVNAGILLPVSESGIRLAAARRRDLETVTAVTSLPPLDAFDTAVDKWRFAEYMQTHGIPTPRTILVQASARLDELVFPALLKPTHGTNGSYIRQFDDRASLARFLEAERKEARVYIIQNLVRGYDIDCSVLCRDGEILAYTIQKGIILNSQRFRPPLAIEFLQHDEVLQVTSKLISALRWSGVAHLDLMVDEADGRVKVIELNARYWGSLLGSLAAGVNFPYLACLEGFGRSLPQAGYRHIRYIEPNVALRALACRSLARGVGNFRFSETGWRYLLADPLPVVADKCRGLWGSLKTRLGKHNRDAAGKKTSPRRAE